MLPALIAPLIAGGAALAAGGLSAGAQIGINNQNVKYATKQLKMQRDWALSDWDKVNAYNHPAQQMQRYKEAGLNPHLIYGSAQNSPASMVRQTSQEAPKLEAQGILQGIGQVGQGATQAANNYFAQKSLENSTALTQAQILKMKADTDRTNQQIKLTGEQWNDLIEGPLFKNLQAANQMEFNDARRNILPTRAMAWEKYLADTARTDASAAHAMSLYNLAKQEGLLKQGDIDTLEALGTSKMGWGTITTFLKEILSAGARKLFK